MNDIIQMNVREEYNKATTLIELIDNQSSVTYDEYTLCVNSNNVKVIDIHLICPPQLYIIGAIPFIENTSTGERTIESYEDRNNVHKSRFYVHLLSKDVTYKVGLQFYGIDRNDKSLNCTKYIQRFVIDRSENKMGESFIKKLFQPHEYPDRYVPYSLSQLLYSTIDWSKDSRDVKTLNNCPLFQFIQTLRLYNKNDRFNSLSSIIFNDEFMKRFDNKGKPSSKLDTKTISDAMKTITLLVTYENRVDKELLTKMINITSKH
jgi:hypothetical protein